jgi:protein-tyrosine phosphatase
VAVYWVKTETCKLAIMPRPRGGDWLEDEIRALKKSGVDVIVSALERDEVEELQLEQEEEVCRTAGVEFLSFPIPDRSLPESVERFEAFVESADRHLSAGKAIVVHCRAGIGRSTMIAASLLLRQGHSAAEAFALLEQARGYPVPDTPEQREWVERFAERAKRHAGNDGRAK